MELVEKDQLVNYLKNAVELENQVYGLNKAIDQSKDTISILKEELNYKERYIKEPVDNTNEISKPTEPIEPNKPKAKDVLVFLAAAVGFILFGLIFCVIGVPFFGYILISIGLFALWGVILIFKDFRTYKKEMKKYEENLAKYKEDLAKYEKEVKRAKEKYKNEKMKYDEKIREYEEEYKDKNKIRKNNYKVGQQLVKSLESSLEKSKKTLVKFYSVDVIFPKYRNLVAICAIYEYFASGRVSTLEGPNGAYNLFEAELRQEIIINKMDTIINQLDQIKQNQYTLYEELSETNKQLNGISKDINRVVKSTEKISQDVETIKEYSAINAYTLHAIEKNTEAIKYLKLING